MATSTSSCLNFPLNNNLMATLKASTALQQDSIQLLQIPLGEAKATKNFLQVSSNKVSCLKVLQINFGRAEAANSTRHPTAVKLQ
ncbi:hypothetical protein AVEN_196303-1 [Araneus ventricosus]|uniref:Uncharacterized protein n=1 Tax=Araneus ventricosus TaxID=182803 RepID=A0A4Y2LMA4_ARAVE|nr:hypothetical protein AVEN_196303-1 [Araneus ventricosus]